MTTNPEYRPTMPLAEVLQDWQDCNMRLRSKETVRLMRASVATFTQHLGHEPVLADLTERTMTGYIGWRLGLGRSPRTVEREAAKVTTLWRWAAARGWTRFPLMSFRKSSPPTPVAWSRDELKRLFDAAAKYEVPMVLDTSRGAMAQKNGVSCGPIMLALVRLCFETAERITAIMLLRWEDVDLDGRWVTFRADTRKGGDRAGDNVQKLSRRTVNALCEMRTLIETRVAVEPDSTVFPKKDKATYLLHLRRILQNAGLPADRRHMFHCLRRTHATHLYIAGGDPTFSLGHTTEQMTREYYLDPRYVRQDYAADQLAGGVVGLLRRLWRRAKAAAGIW